MRFLEVMVCTRDHLGAKIVSSFFLSLLLAAAVLLLLHTIIFVSYLLLSLFSVNFNLSFCFIDTCIEENHTHTHEIHRRPIKLSVLKTDEHANLIILSTCIANAFFLSQNGEAICHCLVHTDESNNEKTGNHK